jgi:hypothetical protein
MTYALHAPRFPRSPRTDTCGTASTIEPRQEPSAAIPHARICAGGGPESSMKNRPYRDPLSIGLDRGLRRAARGTAWAREVASQTPHRRTH